MTKERDVEVTYAVPDFAAELRRLADALEAGNAFEIDVDGETVSVPLDAVVLVEHEREDGVEEIEFQLRWNYAVDENEEDEEEASEIEAEEEEAA